MNCKDRRIVSVELVLSMSLLELRKTGEIKVSQRKDHRVRFLHSQQEFIRVLVPGFWKIDVSKLGGR